MTSQVSLQSRLEQMIEAPLAQNFILVVIIVNAIALGLATSAEVMESYGGLVTSVDRIALVIFCIELSVKLAIYRSRFWSSWWNIFDFVIVGLSLGPVLGNISVLRAFRILRALRLLSVVPQMRQVVQALLGALPGMGSVMVVLGLLFYVSGVIATRMFGAAFPEWFGDLGNSIYSLFQIMTLESWSMGIVRPVMEEFPWAWAFFVPFIIATAFMVLNLFIALIVNAMQQVYEQEQDEADEQRDRGIEEQLQSMRSELVEIKEMMKR